MRWLCRVRRRLARAVSRHRSGFADPFVSSGHAATVAMLTGVIVLHLPDDRRRRWSWLLLVLAGLVGLSRVVVGAHWPLDVLAGVTGGWLAAVLGTVWAQRWAWASRRPGGVG
ncbi:MAG: phosphatase PAP2 family protein [Candidatus Competibacteraceae bacterium]|nr:phosphatase PAP2 family protein [Candidatus Competibacteraceae bacterium]